MENIKLNLIEDYTQHGIERITDIEINHNKIAEIMSEELEKIYGTKFYFNE